MSHENKKKQTIKKKHNTQNKKKETNVERNLIIKWLVLTTAIVLSSLIPAIYAGVTEINSLAFNFILSFYIIVNCMCLMFYNKPYKKVYHSICCLCHGVCHSFAEPKLKQVILQTSPQTKSQSPKINDLRVFSTATNQNTDQTMTVTP